MSITRKKIKTFLSRFLHPSGTAIYFSLVGVVVSVMSVSLIYMKPSVSFPIARIIPVEAGLGVKAIAEYLEGREVIQSAFLFQASVIFSGKSTQVLAGDYFFDEPLSTFDVVQRLTSGEYGLEPERITVYEGSTIYDIAELFESRFSDFDKDVFIAKAKSMEGLLFPDTYLFLPNVTAEQVIEEMHDTFLLRIGELVPEIDSSGMTVKEVVIMASIIEREAWKENDQKLISGVLWNRIAIGMLLQVDATFNYINGKDTYELTYDDLAIDSPYNTYKYKGLPPGPIANPGLGAIKAALFPTESDYLFYLADREGNTYYSVDFEGHKYNKRLYVYQ